MILEGTIVNGHVRLDAPSPLPEGTRVRLVTDEDDWMPHPPAPTETYQQHLSLLRESILESRAGAAGMSTDEAFAKLDAECFGGKIP